MLGKKFELIEEERAGERHGNRLVLHGMSREVKR